MAIHNEVERHMGAAHIKEIDESAIELIMSNLQRSQYQFPIKSTVREITANGVDSVAEKKVAKLILSGKAKIEDFYVERDGEVFRDSKFDSTYYDLKWLSDDDKVKITYIVGENMQKDQVVISDCGVGLGGRRLEKYFSLGYSTKRLSKLPLGKFGIGAKAPLSTGNDFYTMESRYNGQKFKFNIYNRTVDSIIPRFDLNTGRENSHVLFNQGTEHEYKVYWEPTEEKNGVLVYVDAKKTHRNQYVEAVKSQLLYFDNIEMTIVENGHSIVVPYKATILYEDDHIVLSDNPYYSKPHLLLNKISYGYIDWGELELQDITGNIGIKVAPEAVEVNPSRESINWSDQTKATVLEKLGTVGEIATRFINEELKEPDFWKWLKTCFSVGGRFNNGNGIIGRLAKVVDLHALKPHYSKDQRIRFSKELVDFEAFEVHYEGVFKNNIRKTIVQRKEVKNLGSHINLPLILRENDERASNRKDKYLLSLYTQGFILMTEPGTHWMYRNDPKNHPIIKSDKSISNAELWEYLLHSHETIVYSEIKVPENFTGTDEEEDDKDGESVEEVAEAQVARQTAEERRKVEGKIVVHTPRAVDNDCNAFDIKWETDPDNPGYSRPTDIDKWKIPAAKNKAYEWQKLEVPIKAINEWEAEEIYYCGEADNELAHFTAMLTRNTHPANHIGHGTRRNYTADRSKWTESKWYRKNKAFVEGIGMSYNAFYCQHFFDAPVMLVKASQANQKYLRDFRPIQQFFIRVQNNTITMSNRLIKWNTARIIKDKLAAAAFLFNFEPFNSKYAEKYKQLTDYVDKYYTEVGQQQNNGFYGLNPSTYNDLLSHLDNVRKFQEYVAANPTDVDTIAVMAGQLFGNKEIKDGMAVDPEIMETMEQVSEFALGCGTMLNYIPVLTGYGTVQETTYKPGWANRTKSTISEQFEQEIKLYLEYKGMLTNYDTTLDDAFVPEDTAETQTEEIAELEEVDSSVDRGGVSLF